MMRWITSLFRSNRPKLYVCPHCASPYWRTNGQKLGTVAGLSVDCVVAIRKAGG